MSPRPRRFARTTVAILAGLAVGFIVATALIAGADAIVGTFAPKRDDLITNDRSALLQHARAMFDALLVGMALACAVGAVVGSWVAARIAPGSQLARVLVVGCVLLLGATQAVLLDGHHLLVATIAIALFFLCMRISHRLAPRENDAA